MELELFVKDELFVRKKPTVYIVDKNGIGHSRKDIEDNIGISVRNQQSLMRNRREKKGTEGKRQTPLSSWGLENLCNLAAYLGYSVDELLDEAAVNEIRQDTLKRKEDLKRRKSEWNSPQIQIYPSRGN